MCVNNFVSYNNMNKIQISHEMYIKKLMVTQVVRHCNSGHCAVYDMSLALQKPSMFAYVTYVSSHTYSKFVVMVTVMVIMLLCYHSYLCGLRYGNSFYYV